MKKLQKQEKNSKKKVYLPNFFIWQNVNKYTFSFLLKVLLQNVKSEASTRPYLESDTEANKKKSVF